MFGQRKLKRILAVVEDVHFEVSGWSASVRETNRRLDLIEKGQRTMAGEIEALIDQLLAMVARMSDDAEEVAAPKEGIAVIRNDLQVQVEQNEAALAPPAPQAEG